ncbi:MAG: T9SS type A sorting domain-containing protein [Bacteroidales bacterium]|nr:T9SS type A sorting domain-containing protein [Bacteroidales bacterium]
MKQTLTFFFVILLFLFPRLYAQDFWETLPFPDTAHVKSIAVNNQGHIFIGAGSNNTIGGVYRSIDGGLNWEFVLNMDDFGVLSLEINNQGTIYAGTNHAFHPLYASYDNGVTWKELPIPTNLNVIKIKSRGADTLYVSLWVGNGPLVLKSEDGGLNWDTIFYDQPPTFTVQYVKDIAITKSGIIYLCLQGYFPDSGGVYKSEDDGATWELSGLFNHMLSSLAINSQNDLFAGAWGGVPGLHVLRNGEEEWTKLLDGPNITDVAISSIDHIYLGSHGPNGVIRSLDNGLTFEMITDGLVLGIINGLTIDINSYIYAFNTKLSRSINPLVSVFEPDSEKTSLISKLFPNPVHDFLFVEFPEAFFQHENIPVIIYDIAGNSWLSASIDTAQKTYNFDLSHFASGIYIAEFQLQHRNHRQLFIKY